MSNKEKELEKEQQSIRDEVREWWQELDFERQMLRKEAEANREELEDKQNSLEGSRMITGDSYRISWNDSMNRWLRLSCFRMILPLLCVWIYILQIHPKEPWWGEP